LFQTAAVKGQSMQRWMAVSDVERQRWHLVSCGQPWWQACQQWGASHAEPARRITCTRARRLQSERGILCGFP
jgi:hypothetical protein